MGSLISNDFLAVVAAKVTSTDSSKLIEKWVSFDYFYKIHNFITVTLVLLQQI
jgi:hypothetical protein